MLDFIFTAQSPLDGYQKDFDGISVAEVVNRAIISIATPQGGEAALAKAIAGQYNAEVPTLGNSVVSEVDNSRFLALQQDLLFHIFDYEQPNALQHVKPKLGGCAHLTDQSDSWVMLKISGPQSREALARICPVNLHPDVFSKGRVVRSLMEHLGVTILRDGSNSFVLLAPRSSAKSLLGAVITSIENVVCDDRAAKTSSIPAPDYAQNRNIETT